MPRALPLLLALLAACAPEPDGARAPASLPAPDPAVAPSAPPADAASAPSDSTEWTVGVVDLPPSGDAQAVLADLRAARHAGYDRVTFEFEAARPAVHVEYVDRPVRACGSGEPVDLPGEGWLLVRFTGARAHTEAGEPTVDPGRRELGLPAALTLARTCDFEGEVSWVVAVAAPNAVRVTALAGPPRVAVDVRHD